MGLLHTRGTLVGTPLKKGISGGERKRLCVAQELLTRPLLLFLDEPTSGLDSVTALSLITTMRRIADARECTVVTTIHQPQSKIFNLFNHLLLLQKVRAQLCSHLLRQGRVPVLAPGEGSRSQRMPRLPARAQRGAGEAGHADDRFGVLRPRPVLVPRRARLCTRAWRRARWTTLPAAATPAPRTRTPVRPPPLLPWSQPPRHAAPHTSAVQHLLTTLRLSARRPADGFRAFDHVAALCAAPSGSFRAFVALTSAAARAALCSSQPTTFWTSSRPT